MADKTLDEQRRERKAARIREKLMRLPVNDVVLEVQKGYIDIKDFFKAVEERLAEKVKEAKNG